MGQENASKRAYALLHTTHDGVAPIASAYYDDTAGDKQVAYQYLDQVEKDVGFETFAATSDAYSRRLLD